MKNQIEKIMTKTIKAYDWLWGMKLQVMPLAFCTSPGDFIIDYVHNGYGLIVCLIECKRINMSAQKPKLNFQRLKQLHDMLAFSNKRTNHLAFFLIGFWDKRWSNSDLYFVPANMIKNLVDTYHKKSITRKEFFEYFEAKKVVVSNGSIICKQDLAKLMNHRLEIKKREKFKRENK